jgi:hypothetical protein
VLCVCPTAEESMLIVEPYLGQGNFSTEHTQKQKKHGSHANIFLSSCLIAIIGVMHVKSGMDTDCKHYTL